MIIALVAICLAEDGSAASAPATNTAGNTTPPADPAPANGTPVTTVTNGGSPPGGGAAGDPQPAGGPATPPEGATTATEGAATTAPEGAAATAPEGAAATAPEGAAATAPEGAAATAPVAAEEEPKRDRIAELSLVRVDEGGGWGLTDGRGRAVDARTLAILSGDADLLGRVEAARKKGRTLGWGLVIGGGAVALSSTIPLFTMEEALSQSESTEGFDEVGVRNDVRVATAFSLIGAGVLLAGSGLAANAIADRRAVDVSRHLDAEAAEAAVRRYNQRLIDTLTVAPYVEPAKVEEVVEPEDADAPLDESPEAIEKAVEGATKELAQPAGGAAPPATAPTGPMPSGSPLAPSSAPPVVK